LSAALLAIAWTSPPAEARDAARQRIDIPATTLARAIDELSREAGVSIGTEGNLPALRTPVVRGQMTVDQALARMLAGSGFAARRVGPTAWRIERKTVNLPRDTPAPVVVAEPVAQTIVVTAAKRESPLARIPMAVSVFVPPPADSISPALSTNRVAAATEGLSLTGLGPGRNRMFLRGIADSAFNGESQSTVAVLLDGTRLTYTAPDPDLRLVDIARTEVIKGPQGSLYGTGALGGIYHIVTNRPEMDRFDARVSAGASAVQGGYAGFSVSAMVNVPIAADRAALRLVGYITDEPGWIDTGPRRNSNRTTVTGGRAALGVQIAGDWRFDVAGLTQFITARDSQYVYAPGARGRPAQLSEPHDNDLMHIAAKLTHRGAIDIDLISGATWHEVGNRFDARVGAGQFGLANPLSLQDDREYRVYDHELRASSDAGPIRWLAGLSHVRASQNLALELSSATQTLMLDDHRRTTTDTALFGDVGIAVTRALTLDVGGRLFHTSVSDTRMVLQARESEREGRTGFTPSLALSWHPDDRSLMFLRYGSAVRQGGTDFSRSSAGAPVMLKGDELATIEAGWRQQIGAARVDAGLWYSTWENIQSGILGTDGLVTTRNAGQGRILGAEGSITFTLGEGWQAEGGLSLVKARLVRNDLGIVLEDRRLPVVPDYVVRAAVSKDFMLAGSNASVALRLRYVGPSALSFDPLVNRPMGKLIEGHIEGRAELAGLTFTARIDNLFGEDEDAFAFGNPLRFATQRQYTPMAPRQISVAVTARF
jgi:iron complex outermembrane receptor protein